MKALLLIGGLLGFGIGIAFSWAQGSAWPSSLWRACIAAYATSYLMRWWGQAWKKNLEQALAERQANEMTLKASSLSNANKS